MDKVTQAGLTRAANSRLSRKAQVNAVAAYLHKKGLPLEDVESPKYQEGYGADGGKIYYFNWHLPDGKVVALAVGNVYEPEVQLVDPAVDPLDDAPLGAYTPAMDETLDSGRRASIRRVARRSAPKAKAKPKARTKPPTRSKPKVRSKPKPKPRSKPKSRTRSKPKIDETAAVAAALDRVAQTGDEDSALGVLRKYPKAARGARSGAGVSSNEELVAMYFNEYQDNAPEPVAPAGDDDAMFAKLAAIMQSMEPE